MSSWNNYPKIFQVGHGGVRDIFMHRVLVQEKIDGSQFSFGQIEGRLRMKSHHQDISDIKGEWGLFTEAIKYVRELFDAGKLHEGWTYRGEVLSKPCHNKLAYERVPKHNIIGYDVAIGCEQYLEYTDVVAAFNRLDLEIVPYYFYGVVTNPETIKTYLDRRPILGGKIIEGMVIKAHGHYGEDKHTLMAKLVNPEYREINDTGENQKGKDFQQELVDTYRTEARWDKAILHLKEQGLIKGEAQDIGPLIGEISRDLKSEAEDEIKAKLWKRFWPQVSRGCTGGFAEYYKRKLMEAAFVQDTDAKPDPITGGVATEVGDVVGLQGAGIDTSGAESAT